MLKKASNLAVLSMLTIYGLNAWEDHPDTQDHRDTDRIFRDAQEATGAGDQGKDSYHHDRDSRGYESFGNDRTDSDRGTVLDRPDRDK